MFMMNQIRSTIAGGLAILASAASAFGGTKDVANVVSNDTPVLAGSSLASTNDVSNVASNDYSVAGVASNDYSVAGVASNDTPVAMAIVANRPHITRISREVKPAFPNRVYVTVSATNLTQGVNYYVHDSTDLKTWTSRLAKCYNATSDLNKEISATVAYASDDFKRNGFFKLGTK